MPRLRPRIEITQLEDDRYELKALYGTRSLSPPAAVDRAVAQRWLWDQIAALRLMGALDVVYNDSDVEGTAEGQF